MPLSVDKLKLFPFFYCFTMDFYFKLCDNGWTAFVSLHVIVNYKSGYQISQFMVEFHLLCFNGQ